MADLVVTVPSGTLTLPADVIVPAARIPDLPADAVSSVNGETGAVVLDAADVGAAPALGADDNYVTDAEKAALHTHPAVVGQGATQADARTALGLGTAAVAATGDFATAAQGGLADSAVQPGDLGNAASLDVGTTAGTLAAGDDSRITGALPAANLDTAVTALDANPASTLRVQQDARLSSTIAAQATPLRRGVASQSSQLLAAIDAGRSAAICLVGDSTGNETLEWFHQLALTLVGEMPDHVVVSRLWNTVTQQHDAPTTLQAQAGTARHMVVDTLNRIATPDATLNQITGDLDVRVHVALDDWSTGAEQVLACKYGADGQRGWRFCLNSSGAPFFDWTEDGSTAKGPKTASGFSVPADGAGAWLRVTLDVDNGASGHDVRFYESEDGQAWTQLGSTSTTAGVTSIHNSTSDLQIGARSGFTSAPGGSPMVGKVYHVEIRSGIDGPMVAPVLPEHWSHQSTGMTAVGDPIFTVVNSSHPGADLTYLINSTRLGRMTPDYGQALTILSCSHNDAARTGPRYLADWGTLLAAVQARLPYSGMALCTQNPRLSPATNIAEHSARRADLIGWAIRNGLGVIDAYGAFQRDSRGVAALTKVDGIHPSDEGSLVWSAAAEAVILGTVAP